MRCLTHSVMGRVARCRLVAYKNGIIYTDKRHPLMLKRGGQAKVQLFLFIGDGNHTLEAPWALIFR